MSAGRIQEAALLRFAAQGYDATSLAQIAGDVGIKTPSIYAHFKSKQALFLGIVEYVLDSELTRVREGLERPEWVGAAMRRYLERTVERFEEGPNLRFWLRTIYLPPPAIFPQISDYDRNFAIALEKIVSSALRHPTFGLKNPVLPYETLSMAFIGMLRSIHAELLYCSSSDSKCVLNAMWAIFERSLVEK